MTKSQRDLKSFMMLAQECAIADAKLMPTTPDIKRRAHALAEFARDRLAQQIREERAKRPTNVVSGVIRGWIRLLGIPEAIALLELRARQYPTMQIAHRDYKEMPPEDIYSALEDVESLIERGD